MKFYFSGIETQHELELLNQAGATHILLDLHQHATVNRYSTDARILIDSDAHRTWQQGLPRGSWHQQAQTYRDQVTFWQRSNYDFFLAYDVVGKPELSHGFWERFFRLSHDNRFIPVWHPKTGATMRELERYLDQAPVVTLGGLADHLLDNQVHDETIEWIGELATLYPHRFHLSGCNSAHAISRLAHLLHSASSDLWLAGRNGQILFQQDGDFTQAHAHAIPKYAGTAPDLLCIHNARNIQAFCRVS